MNDQIISLDAFKALLTPRDLRNSSVGRFLHLAETYGKKVLDNKHGKVTCEITLNESFGDGQSFSLSVRAYETLCYGSAHAIYTLRIPSRKAGKIIRRQTSLRVMAWISYGSDDNKTADERDFGFRFWSVCETIQGGMDREAKHNA